MGGQDRGMTAGDQPVPASDQTGPGQVPIEASYWRAPDPSTIKPSAFRSASRRAKVLVGLLWLNLISSVSACAIDLWGMQTIGAFLEDRATIADLELFDTVFAISGILDSAVFVLAAIAWLAWESRTVDNESPLGIGPSPWTPASSIGWWFVPFANLVQPYRVMRDVYRRYHAGDRTPIRIVKVWWALWLVSAFLTNLAGRLWLGLDSLNELKDGLAIWLVADLASLALVFPAVKLVRAIQDRADQIAIDGPRPTLPTDPAVAIPYA
jgi:hypothetical protein